MDSFDAVKKSDSPPTKIDNKEEIKLVHSSECRRRKEKRMIPLTLIGSEEEIKLVDSSDAGGKSDVIPLTLIYSHFITVLYLLYNTLHVISIV